MIRNASARFGSDASANRASKLLEYLQVHIEPLEDRKLLASQVVFVNDNWQMPAPGVLNLNSAVKDPTSGITRNYGVDAFGTVVGFTSDNTAAAYVTISAAINPGSVNPTGGTISILDGTYAESDIIVDMNVVVKGFASSGASQTLITPGIASTPTIDGNGVVAPLGTNSHSGFLIYSPTVTISNLHVDGGASLNYQHGITTIYQANDGSNTGNYAARSVTGGPVTNLTPIQLNSATPTASPGVGASTHVSILVESVLVENAYYHGISLSARQNENYINTVADNPTTEGPRVNNNVVRNIGAPANRDWQRVGIFLQNIGEAFVSGNQMSNVGTGFAMVPWNDATHGVFGSFSAGGTAGFAPMTATGASPFTLNTVTDAKTRGYDLEFISDSNTVSAANIYNTSNANLATNTTVGLYINYTALILRGWRINGAFIGVEVQNTSRVTPTNVTSTRYPILTTDFIIDKLTPVAGSVGVLGQSGPSFSRPGLSEAGETPFELSAGDTIRGYDTAVKVNQANGFISTRESIVVIDRLSETGNSTGLNLGNHVRVEGAWTGNDPIVVTGANSTFSPAYNPAALQGQRPTAYVNTASPVATPPFPATTATDSAPRPTSISPTQGLPGTIGTNNLTLSASSTFSVRISGSPASTLLDDFSANVPFSSSPQTSISPWRTNGFVVAGIRGPSWQSAGVVTQNGASGVLKIRPNDPSNAVLGATEVVDGYAYHSNMNPVDGVWTTVNAAGFETLEVSLRLPNNLAVAGNGSLTDGFSTINSDTGMRLVRVGLIDIDNTARSWAIPTRILSSSSFTTVRVNLAGPNLVAGGGLPPGSANFADSDAIFNLGQIAGFFVTKENLNGVNTTPFGIIIDRISLLRATGVDQFAVTGNVTLAGATLSGVTNSDFTPSVSQSFTIVDNQGSNPINGTFDNSTGAALPEGSLVTLSQISYRISYIGGTGNDVTLTRVPDNPPARLFYNQSFYDGNNVAVNTTGGANDDTAIASDKFPYMPGQGAMTMAGASFPNKPQSFQHVSGFTRGINGLMIDFPGDHPNITVADFVFKVGNNNTPSLWANAIAPTSVTVRNAGIGLATGDTRVEIIWPNNSIQNTWLEVQVKANVNTGLLDVTQLPNGDGIGYTFFYGSRIGDSGSGDAAAIFTTATDEIGARNNPGSAQPITNRFDYNKDGLVTATDQITSRNNAGSIAFLNVLDPPNAPPPILANPRLEMSRPPFTKISDTSYTGVTGNDITLTGIADNPPTIDLDTAADRNDSTVSYSSSYSQVPIYIAPSATMTDIDDPNVSQMVVDLELNVGTTASPILVAGDHLSVDLPKIIIVDFPGEDDDIYQITGTNIQTAYNKTTGALTLFGSDTKANYISALRKVQYFNDGPAGPMGSLRTATVTPTVNGVSVSATAFIFVPPNAQLFYNQSSFDGNNINVNTTGALNDDTAIATDKTAYAPGSGSMSMSGSLFTGPFANNPASFRHVSSFTRGINGLMIDITGSHPSITASDFIFKTGNNNSPSTWATAAAPTSVTVRTTGVGLTPGNTRVEIIWPNNSIRNTWLEVNVKANVNTGLVDGAQLPAVDGIGHIFFFGNRVGDSGSGDTAAFLTTATDEIGARNNPGSAQPITNRFDYNKDGLVTATDQITSRNNAGSIAFLNVLDPPNAPPAPAALTSDGNGVASALNLGSGGGGGTTSGWVANRLASVDLNSGPVARLFEHLAEKNTPGARKILVAADNIADDLGLEHSLLDSILADLGLE